MVEEIVIQLINWLGHADQHLINYYFLEKFQYFNANQFKQFINNNKLIALETLENEIAKEVCLLTKLIVSEDLTFSLSYIQNNIDNFPTIKKNTSILDRKDKSLFIQKIKDKYSEKLSYDNLEAITKLKESSQYGLTTIENVFSCFGLNETVLFDLTKAHQAEIKEKEKSIFFHKIKKHFL